LLEIYIKKIILQDKTAIVINIQKRLARWDWSIRFSIYFHSCPFAYNVFHLFRDTA